LMLESEANGAVHEVSRVQTQMRVVWLALSKEEQRLLLKSKMHFIVETV